MNMTQLQALKKVVGDMRFIQATALVSSAMSESKDAQKYMRELAQLEKVIDVEMQEQR
jgi:division protein CdvB (Snf7/Vps24/ESCRT-III family)